MFCRYWDVNLLKIHTNVNHKYQSVPRSKHTPTPLNKQVRYCRTTIRTKHINFFLRAEREILNTKPCSSCCTRWRSWLRLCDTSQKFAVSIPGGMIGIFHCHNPSRPTTVLASKQPLFFKMSTSNISYGGKGGRCVGLTTLPSSRSDCLEIWKPQPTGTLRAWISLYKNCLNFYLVADKYITGLKGLKQALIVLT